MTDLADTLSKCFRIQSATPGLGLAFGPPKCSNNSTQLVNVAVERATREGVFVISTASPTGISDYVYYSSGGWSWSVPWIAGLYALACEVDPGITPERFWTVALETGRTMQIQNGTETLELGTIADPVTLVVRLEAGLGKR